MTLEISWFRRLALLGVMAVMVVPSLARLSPQDEPGDGDGPVNAMCPVTTEESVDPRFTVEYQGQTVGFCCRKCRTQFEADPAAYVANLPVSFSSAAQTEEEHEHGDHADAHEHTGEDQPDSTGDGVGEDQHVHEHAGEDQPGSSHEVVDEGEHDHEHSHGSEGRSELAVWIGKFHPPATHLPIGLLIGALIAEIGMIVTGRMWFRHAAGFCLVLGTLGAIAAATLGWLNGGFAVWDGDWVQATHRWLGTGTAALSLVSVLFYTRMSRSKSESAPARWYRVSLFVTTSLVGAAGFFGGALVYGINHYAW